MMYSSVSPGIPSHVAEASVEPWARAKTEPSISSFEKKPESGGMPEIASVAIHIRTNVTGRKRLSPPMLRMSCASSSLWVP